MSAGAAPLSQDAATAPRSPLEVLLHALNQPLTGLQCSMEVALASPRTVEYYAQRLREALELTERMRALVTAIREVAEVEAGNNDELEKRLGKNGEQESIEWSTLWREVANDLEPVAEVKRVRMVLELLPAVLWSVPAKRRKLFALAFRTLESILAQAERGSMLRIEAREGAANSEASESSLCVSWQTGPRLGEFSTPELGLLVARAGWERLGAMWERVRAGSLETLTLRTRIPGGSGGS